VASPTGRGASASRLPHLAGSHFACGRGASPNDSSLYSLCMKTFAICLLLLAGCCSHPVQRFVPLTGESASTMLALDTKTGQVCWTVASDKEKPEELPLCKDLYKQ
jgi:hypothetical protein